MTPEQEKKLDEIGQTLALLSQAMAGMKQDQARALQAAGLLPAPETEKRPAVMDRIGARKRGNNQAEA